MIHLHPADCADKFSFTTEMEAVAEAAADHWQVSTIDQHSG